MNINEYTKEELEAKINAGEYKNYTWTSHVPNMVWFPRDTALIIKGVGVIPKQVLKYTLP